MKCIIKDELEKGKNSVMEKDAVHKHKFELLLNEEVIIEAKACSAFFKKCVDYFVANNYIKDKNDIPFKLEKSDEGFNQGTYEVTIRGERYFYSKNVGNEEIITRIKKCFDIMKNNGHDISGYSIIMEKSENTDKNQAEGDERKDAGMKTIEQVLDELLGAEGEKGTVRQVILTGAPGTGKTYSAKKWAINQALAQSEFLAEEIDIKKRELAANLYSEGREIPEDIEKQAKMALAMDKYYRFVQFHSSYDYSDFVEGLRPVVSENGENIFVRMDGTFKNFCRKIVKDNNKDKKYFFIIDEINRADLSRVFGELMYCLDEAYRGKYTKSGMFNGIKTQYSNLPAYGIGEETDCFKDGFYIPENLYIIGTMNDIDRSVEAFDFALRRRFRWFDVKANDVMLYELESMIADNAEDRDEAKKLAADLAERAKAMNRIMSDNDYKKLGLGEEYYIGPAYFKDYNGKNIDMIFEQKVVPIIREYTRGKGDISDELVRDCKKALLPEQPEELEQDSQESAAASSTGDAE